MAVEFSDEFRFVTAPVFELCGVGSKVLVGEVIEGIKTRRWTVWAELLPQQGSDVAITRDNNYWVSFRFERRGAIWSRGGGHRSPQPMTELDCGCETIRLSLFGSHRLRGRHWTNEIRSRAATEEGA